MTELPANSKMHIEEQRNGYGALAASAPPDSARQDFGLASLVAPMELGEFMSEYYGKRVLHQRGAAGRYTDLLTFEDLNHILRDHRLTPPRFRLSRGGETLPETAYTHVVSTLRGPLKQIHVARLVEALRDGATLVLDGVDQQHPPIRPIKDALERELDAQVWINTYVSWGVTNGFPYHWDDHDTIMLQVKGRKRWQLHPPTLLSPTRDDVRRAEKPRGFTMDIVVEPGDMLYVPRGFWHLVVPMDEPTIHLTVGVLRPTNIDLLSWLISRVRLDDFVREDVPLRLNAQSRDEHAARLRSVIDAALDGRAIEAFANEQRDGHGLDPRPSLQVIQERDAAQWDPAAEVVLLSSRAEVVEERDRAVLRAAGRSWPAPLAATATLRVLAAGGKLALGAVVNAISAPIVSELVSAGVLAVV